MGFQIEVPTKKPNGDPIKTVGIWMSGGADSSYVCYAVCKYIKDNNLDVRVQPYTMRIWKPANPSYAVPVSSKIRELLNIDFMNHHVVYYPPINTQEEIEYSSSRKCFVDIDFDNFKNKNIDVLFSGLTMNPPKSVQLDFKDKDSGVEHIRGEEAEKTHEWFGSTDSGIEYYYIDPICHINKRDLALLYEQEGIIDTIFPMTRSCEMTRWKEDGTPDHPTEGHCGECWWCEERLWAFGRLE